MRQAIRNRRGASFVGIAIAIACLAVLGSIVLVLIWHARQAHAMRALDGTRIRHMHEASVSIADEFGIPYAAPGLLKRRPAPGLDRPVPGVGPEDVTQNTTANFCSMLIAQHYLTPEKCIGPTEPSGRVVICEGYDWAQYKPEAGVYWDATFKADLSRLSNASYAHLPLFPESARNRHWTAEGDANVPVIGNRGPAGGTDPASVTYAIHDPPDRWLGHMCYRDNHVDFIETMTPHQADNIFSLDEGLTGGDAIIAFTKDMNDDGPTVQHD